MSTKGEIVRPAETPDDIERAVALLRSPGIRPLAEQEGEPFPIHILLRGDEVVGALAHRLEHWELGETRFKVARVWECTGESGDNAFRRTGDRSVFDALVSGWREYLRKNGYHLAFTHGELALWPVHHFYPCFYHPRVYIPTAKALRLRPVYKVRGVKTTDARPMRRLMEKNQGLRPRVYAAGVPNFHHHAVEGPGGKVFGYFSMAVTDGNGQPPVFIPEAEVENREAAETILAHAAPFAQEKGMRALHFALAAEHPFSVACLDLGGYFQLRGTTRDITLDEEMVRLVDVRGCLSVLSEALAARIDRAGMAGTVKELVLNVEGEKVPLKRKRNHLAVDDAAAGAPAIRIPRWAFTQMLMGYRSASGLRARVIRPAAAQDLLDVLFPTTWPLSLCDHDLWDPSLRNPDKYCEAALVEIRKLRYPF